jgi:LEA14-like dessication related protein
MTSQKGFRIGVIAGVCLVLAACAMLQQRDPLQVTVAGIEPMQGQGMELRMLVKLRVQNPNDSPVDYDGVSVKIDVQGSTFATGVSDERGTVPRFGESVISVPVTVSAMRMVRGALGMMGDKSPATARKVSYSLTGKLHGSAFSSVRFESKGDIDLPEPAPAGVNPT